MVQAAGAQLKIKHSLPLLQHQNLQLRENVRVRETLHPNTITNTTCLPELFFPPKVERQIQPLENSLALTKNITVSG